MAAKFMLIKAISHFVGNTAFGQFWWSLFIYIKEASVCFFVCVCVCVGPLSQKHTDNLLASSFSSLSSLAEQLIYHPDWLFPASISLEEGTAPVSDFTPNPTEVET